MRLQSQEKDAYELEVFTLKLEFVHVLWDQLGQGDGSVTAKTEFFWDNKSSTGEFLPTKHQHGTTKLASNLNHSYHFRPAWRI